MAAEPSQMPVFSRGSAVLEYWLVHAEGLVVQPLQARVEQVVVALPAGRAEALIVRSKVTGRRKAIPAGAIAAVEPSSGRLLLDMQEEARTTRALQWTKATTTAVLSWLLPRARLGWAVVASHARRAAVRTAQGIEWLAPRLERGAARLARQAERAAVLAAEHARGALEAHHARRAGVPRPAQGRKPRARR